MHFCTFTKSLRRGFLNHLPESTICAVGTVAFVIVWPFGEYAILDDWAYVLSLRHLQVDRRLVVMDWNPMNLIGHLLWGWVFTSIFGFSFFVTKVAVGVAGVVCVLALYKFLQKSNVDPRLALLASLSLLLNPLYSFHMTLFMTDVTCLMYVWLAVLCWSGVLIGRSRMPLVALAMGSLFSGLAYLTRQHAVALPIAFVAYAAWNSRQLLRWRTLTAALLPTCLIVVAGTAWLESSSDQPRSAYRISAHLVHEFCYSPPWNELPHIVWSYAVYVGLFVGPTVLATICVSGSPRTTHKWLLFFVAVAFGFGYWCYATIHNLHFPFIRNVVTEWGFFHPDEFVIGERPVLWGASVGAVIGEVGILSAIGFLWCVWMVRNKRVAPEDISSLETVASHQAIRRFMLLLFALQFGYVFATSPILFDRHLLVVAPTAIAIAALACERSRSPRSYLSGIWLSAYAAYGISCGHDIHAVSREVFLTGVDLHDRGIPFENIDGGYAFDGWYLYERSQKEMPAEPMVMPPWWPTQHNWGTPAARPWWIYGLIKKVDPEYAVTLSRHSAYPIYDGRHYDEIDSSRSYLSYWPLRWNRIHLLRRQPDAKPPED